MVAQIDRPLERRVVNVHRRPLKTRASAVPARSRSLLRKELGTADCKTLGENGHPIREHQCWSSGRVESTYYLMPMAGRISMVETRLQFGSNRRAVSWGSSRPSGRSVRPSSGILERRAGRLKA